MSLKINIKMGELVYVPAGVTLHQEDPDLKGVVSDHTCLSEPKYLLCLGEGNPHKVAVVYKNARWLAHERDIYQVHEREGNDDC